ncbi:MAG: ABC transporter ATP-binding protein [Alphaproteobacteria bacterium]|nr:ABC transporter ATP-binding protein [Alphaproteobacteria bacterium]MDD9920450.1 ABC transporter ATP-binding protein [Alphaproteobacteria bacterium]
MPLLSVKNLTLTVPNATLVDGVSFTLEKGKTLCVVGESGSGKTLSSLAIMGLLPKTIQAKVEELAFSDINLNTLTARQHRQLRGSRMSMIFQEPLSALNPVMTMGKQVAEVLQIHTKLNKKERYEKVLALFEQVKLPEPKRIYASYPHQLSGGQRQRVMIAMALACQPELLIADEPTTALDATVQKEILKLIKELQGEFKTAVLFITHDFGVVKQIADDVLVMEHGKVVEQGAANTILSKPKKAYTKRLLAAAPQLNTKPHAEISGDILLKAENVNKTYTRGGGLFGAKQKVNAVQNASLTLYKGQTIGIVGESGSGKSTLAKCILQLEKPNSGDIQLNGQQLVGLKGKKLRTAWRDMQMIFQDPFASLNPRQTVGTSIAEGLKAHGIGTEQERQTKVAELLKAVELPVDAANRYPHQFSGGQRQRIGIARALALNPALVVADEAVASLDVSVQKQVLELMNKLKQDFGLSYLFISHDLRVVSQVADWVLVMHQGQVVEQGPTHKVFGSPQQAYTQQLLASLPG